MYFSGLELFSVQQNDRSQVYWLHCRHICLIGPTEIKQHFLSVNHMSDVVNLEKNISEIKREKSILHLFLV